MEILGVGPLELLFIFLIALIVLGPQDMKKTGLTLGRFMRKIVTSQGWREFQQGWRNLRYLPNKMMREAGLEEDVKSINESMKEFQKIKPAFDFSDIKEDLQEDLKEAEKDISSWLTPPTGASPPPPSAEPAASASEAAGPSAPTAAEPEKTPGSSNTEADNA